MKVLRVIHITLILFLLEAANSSFNEKSSSVLNFNTHDVLTQIRINIEKYNCQTECCTQLLFYINQIFDAEWAMLMFDSSSKMQSGILSGNLYELGSFDECISIRNETEIGLIKGKYCMGKINLPDSIFQNIWHEPEPKKQQILERELLVPAEDQSLNLKFALCVPAVCSTKELNKLLDDVLFSMNLNVDFIEDKCHEGNSYDLEGVDFVAIVILSLVGMFIVISTTYDLYLQHINLKTNYPILICFSLYTNGYHLFKTTPVESNTGTLNSLHGLRFLSMTWIVYAHCYFLAVAFPLFNLKESDRFVRSVAGQLVVGSSVTVDTFLVMSGLLVSYTLLRQFQNGIRLRDVPLIYLHRYIRITPPYAIMILLQVSIFKFFGSGPLWNTTSKYMSGGCERYWWSSLLYIQNYVNPTDVCLGQSWYLSVDMQLFWIAPLLMMLIRKFNKYTYIIIGTLTAILVTTTFIIAYKNSILAGLFAGTLEMGLIRQKMMYVPTHTRAAPWMIGLALGYFLHKNRGTRILMHPWFIMTGWIICIVTMLSVIFGMHPLMQKNYELNSFADPLYLALSRPAWGAAIAWQIFACENGYGGPINWLLSLPVLQPLARLSYCEYLIHFVLQVSIGGVARAPIYFTNFQMFNKMLSDLFCSLLFATILSLTFESPMVIIEKTIFGKVGKSPKDANKAEEIKKI